MVFYAGKIIQHRAMSNPTLVVLTDRNDLDDQLFGTFSACKELLRSDPRTRRQPRASAKPPASVLRRRDFYHDSKVSFPKQREQVSNPVRSRNIVVIPTKPPQPVRFHRCFARHMRDALPNASFIGFTATPLEVGDRSTPAIFGDYNRRLRHPARRRGRNTVRIFYEGRLAKIELKEEERPKIDPDFEEVTEEEDVPTKEEAEKQMGAAWKQWSAHPSVLP